MTTLRFVILNDVVCRQTSFSTVCFFVVLLVQFNFSFPELYLFSIHISSTVYVIFVLNFFCLLLSTANFFFKEIDFRKVIQLNRLKNGYYCLLLILSIAYGFVRCLHKSFLFSIFLVSSGHSSLHHITKEI